MARALALLLVVFAVAPLASAKTPPWVRAAIPAEIPKYEDTGAVVLLDDLSVSVTPHGRLNTRYRRVVKILTSAGRGEGVARAWFDQENKLKSMRAWSIDASGAEYEVKERDAVETTPTDFELYTDSRMKVLTIPAANPGSIVAFEIESADRPWLPQTVWQFQEEIPVLVARYELLLPAGWSYDAKWLNHQPVAPTGSTWTLTNIPALPDEPRRPASAAIAGKVGFNLLAPGAKPLSWSDIAKWFGDLSTPRSLATAPLQAKTRELTASGDRLRPLARFCQRDVRYVAIEVGIGGYQPHAAGDVFTNRFGDCKDKTTLLRTMLKEAGVDAHQVLIHTTRGATNPSFPYLGAFNHVIAAIPVTADQAKTLDAVIDHPKLGKLLLFDPTSTTTRFGQLPQWLQQTHGLLVTRDGGELIEIPPHKPEASQLRRKGSLQLDENGALSGAIEEVMTGDLASTRRARMQALTATERTRYVESMLANHFASYTASDIAIENLDEPESDLVIRYKVTAPSYAKRVADLLLVRPRVVGEKADSLLDLKKRTLSYETDGPSLQVDEIEIRLPATRKLDELPPKTEVKTPALQYASSSSFENGVLQYRRRYAVHKFEVAREELPELNKAWTQILADERASAVFK